MDAGCGIGNDVFALAERVGPRGQVTGLDVNQEHLDVALAAAEQHGRPANVRFRLGDLCEIPFADNAFDWAWCRDILWPGVFDWSPAEALDELQRVVKPGGTVALLYWTSDHLLGDHPQLQARLQAAFARTTPYLSAVQPPRQVMRALQWMAEAGLEEMGVHTYVAQLRGPLDERQQAALHHTFAMLYQSTQSVLDPADWRAFQQLYDADSSDFVGRLAGYYGYIVYSMFLGRVKD